LAAASSAQLATEPSDNTWASYVRGGRLSLDTQTDQPENANEVRFRGLPGDGTTVPVAPVSQPKVTFPVDQWSSVRVLLNGPQMTVTCTLGNARTVVTTTWNDPDLVAFNDPLHNWVLTPSLGLNARFRDFVLTEYEPDIVDPGGGGDPGGGDPGEPGTRPFTFDISDPSLRRDDGSAMTPVSVGSVSAINSTSINTGTQYFTMSGRVAGGVINRTNAGSALRPVVVTCTTSGDLADFDGRPGFTGDVSLTGSNVLLHKLWIGGSLTLGGNGNKLLRCMAATGPTTISPNEDSDNCWIGFCQIPSLGNGKTQNSIRWNFQQGGTKNGCRNWRIYCTIFYKQNLNTTGDNEVVYAGPGVPWPDGHDDEPNDVNMRTCRFYGNLAKDPDRFLVYWKHSPDSRFNHVYGTGAYGIDATPVAGSDGLQCHSWRGGCNIFSTNISNRCLSKDQVGIQAWDAQLHNVEMGLGVHMEAFAHCTATGKKALLGAKRAQIYACRGADLQCGSVRTSAGFDFFRTCGPLDIRDYGRTGRVLIAFAKNSGSLQEANFDGAGRCTNEGPFCDGITYAAGSPVPRTPTPLLDRSNVGPRAAGRTAPTT
jgi:hypothetical protein